MRNRFLPETVKRVSVVEQTSTTVELFSSEQWSSTTEGLPERCRDRFRGRNGFPLEIHLRNTFRGPWPLPGERSALFQPKTGDSYSAVLRRRPRTETIKAENKRPEKPAIMNCNAY